MYHFPNELKPARAYFIIVQSTIHILGNLVLTIDRNNADNYCFSRIYYDYFEGPVSTSKLEPLLSFVLLPFRKRKTRMDVKVHRVEMLIEGSKNFLY